MVLLSCSNRCRSWMSSHHGLKLIGRDSVLSTHNPHTRNHGTVDCRNFVLFLCFLARVVIAFRFGVSRAERICARKLWGVRVFLHGLLSRLLQLFFRVFVRNV